MFLSIHTTLPLELKNVNVGDLSFTLRSMGLSFVISSNFDECSEIKINICIYTFYREPGSAHFIPLDIALNINTHVHSGLSYIFAHANIAIFIVTAWKPLFIHHLILGLSWI